MVEPDDVGARRSAVDFAEEAGQILLGALRLALDGHARGQVAHPACQPAVCGCGHGVRAEEDSLDAAAVGCEVDLRKSARLFAYTSTEGRGGEEDAFQRRHCGGG